MCALAVRDVLMGVLAVRERLLDEDELLAALAEWQRDPGRPLTDVLSERLGEKLSQVASAADERLSPPPATERPADSAEGSIDWKPPPGPTRRTAAEGCRYLRLDEHARGGLGIVYKAQDAELKRTVALKEIQAQHADSAGGRTRFMFEAEVTGQLEHPGIVPVYGLGTYGDGRPYYAMRFIKGHTLEEAIKRFHADDAGRDQAERSLALRELLGRFVSTCNAVAYAHSRDVIHRDIKPANVMLGDYGETLVVDWGLAKRLGPASGGRQPSESLNLASGGRQPPESGTPGDASSAQGVNTPRSPVEGTGAGSAVGTPAYMPPEQARGENVGPPSDVYALGATLYQLLTGTVPVKGATVEEVLEKVKRGDLTPARQANSRVPRALEAVCHKAMAFRPEDRYDSAKALADDVERWLGDEPVSAYREPLAKRAARWVSRHRTLTASVAVGVAVALVAVSWIVWDARDREQKRLAEERRKTDQALAERREREQEARRLLADAESLEAAAKRSEPIPASALLAQAIIRIEKAASLVDQGTDEDELRMSVVRKRDALTRQERDREMVERLEEVKRRGQSGRGWLNLGKIRDGYRKEFAAFFGTKDVLTLPKATAIDKARGSPYRADLVAALDDWWCLSSVDEKEEKGVTAQRAKAYELASALDDDPASRRLRTALYQKDLKVLNEVTRDGLGKAAAGWVMRRFPRKFPPDSAELLLPTVCRHVMRAAFLEARLGELYKGTAAPTNADLRLEAAYFGQQPFREKYVAAASVYEGVFAANPTLLESWRVDAARAAAQAGTGHGEDAGRLDEKARAHWRQLALGWLKQELELNASAIFSGEADNENSPAVKQQRQTAQLLLKHADFAGVRESTNLQKLSKEERTAWQHLWTDAQSAAQPPKPREKK